ncbi:TetR/AcrR family transcriptional regulator [Rhodococcus qingshengii]
MIKAAPGATGTATDGRTLRWAYRKTELLNAATDYALNTGVAELTLRPLGEAIGASITTLIRQFGSRDELIREVCQQIHSQAIEAFDQFWASRSGNPAEVLRDLWNLWLDPEYSRQFIFLFELYGLALRDPEHYEWFASSVVYDWIAPLEDALIADGVDAVKAKTLATVVVGIIRGLYLDMAATRDVDRVSAAYEMAVTLLDPVLESHGE